MSRGCSMGQVIDLPRVLDSPGAASTGGSESGNQQIREAGGNGHEAPRAGYACISHSNRATSTATTATASCICGLRLSAVQGPATAFDALWFTVPADFHTHNDSVAAALMTLVGRRFQDVTFNFSISRYCADTLAWYYQLDEIGPVDDITGTTPAGPVPGAQLQRWARFDRDLGTAARSGEGDVQGRHLRVRALPAGPSRLHQLPARCLDPDQPAPAAL